ncbi:MAG: magnesium/cobalt transporter CorA [Verrucomicrobiota bacterium]|nr:magnesium/cobalt transporter CorA [Verrucomicrobiota bacterium]
MIHSFVIENGKVVETNMDLDVLKLVVADKGLHVWIDLENPTPEETRKVLEDIFHFHPLAIEDCVQITSLPKVDDYEDYLFLVMHAVNFNRVDQFSTIELNLFIGKEFLVTWHAEPMRSINTISERCRKLAVIARAPDRLAHAILDQMMDHYNQVLDELSLEVQEIEDSVLTPDAPEMMNNMLTLKKELATLHQTIRPQREVIARLARGEFKLIRSTMLPYYRDLYDHLSKIDGMVTSYKEQLFLTIDIYLNSVANRTGEVIRVLTLLTALTTPLTIIGTWYGMNFDSQPEYKMQHGYAMAVGLLVSSTIMIFIWFRRRKWI